MGFLYEARASDSPYLESVTRGRTEGHGSVIRPAECHWHMVITRVRDESRLLVVGPWTTAGIVSYIEGVELLWIKFRLGAFMPHLPTRNFLDSETVLPAASRRSFWLHGSTWQLPNYDNAETFIEHLAHGNALARDPVVDDVLHHRPHELSARTVRHRFLHVTGLTQGNIAQCERAQRAAALLRSGVPIADTIYETGYFDQPHLTHELKRWLGHTPTQLTGIHHTRRSCQHE